MVRGNEKEKKKSKINRQNAASCRDFQLICSRKRCHKHYLHRVQARTLHLHRTNSSTDHSKWSQGDKADNPHRRTFVVVASVNIPAHLLALLLLLALQRSLRNILCTKVEASAEGRRTSANDTALVSEHHKMKVFFVFVFLSPRKCPAGTVRTWKQSSLAPGNRASPSRESEAKKKIDREQAVQLGGEPTHQHLRSRKCPTNSLTLLPLKSK